MMHDLLTQAASRHRDRTALVTATRRLTYGELDDAAGRFAAGLAGRGIEPGDRATIYSPNRWEWVVAYHGVLKAGAVVNPVNTMLTPAEVAFVVGDCGARALVTTADKVAAIHSAGDPPPVYRGGAAADPDPSEAPFPARWRSSAALAASSACLSSSIRLTSSSERSAATSVKTRSASALSFGMNS